MRRQSQSKWSKTKRSERGVNVKVKVKVKIFFNKGRIERKVVKKKVGYTGGRFRSYVLWGVSHNHPQVGPRMV